MPTNYYPVYKQAYDVYGGSTGGGGTTPMRLAAPSNLRQTANTADTISLAWGAVTGAVGYQLVQGSTIVYSGADTNFSATGLAAASSYSYVVRAVGNGTTTTTSLDSAPLTASTASGAGSPLTAPTGLAANPTTSGILVNWNDVANNAGYGLQRALVTNGLTGSYATVYADQATSYLDTDTKPGAVYRYRVLTQGSGAYTNSSYSAPVQATATPTGQVNKTVEGDSTSAPTGYSWWEQYQAQLQAAAPDRYVKFTNCAVGGESMGTGDQPNQMASPTQIAQVNATLVQGALNLLDFHVGINDINQGRDPVETYNEARDLCQGYVAAGWRVRVKIPTSNRAVGDNVEIYRRFRILFNLIRKGWRTEMGATQLLELQTNPHLSGYDAPLNKDWFLDFIHLTPAGNGEVKDYAVLGDPYFEANIPKVVTSYGIVDSVPQDLLPLSGDWVDTFERGADGPTSNGWVGGTDNYENRGGDLYCINAFQNLPILRPTMANQANVEVRQTFTYTGSVLDIPGLVARSDGGYQGYVSWLRQDLAYGPATLIIYAITSSGTVEFTRTEVDGLLPYHQYEHRFKHVGSYMETSIYDQDGVLLASTSFDNPFRLDGQFGIWPGRSGARIHEFAYKLQ